MPTRRYDSVGNKSTCCHRALVNILYHQHIAAADTRAPLAPENGPTTTMHKIQVAITSPTWRLEDRDRNSSAHKEFPAQRCDNITSAAGSATPNAAAVRDDLFFTPELAGDLLLRRCLNLRSVPHRTDHFICKWDATLSNLSRNGPMLSPKKFARVRE